MAPGRVLLSMVNCRTDKSLPLPSRRRALLHTTSSMHRAKNRRRPRLKMQPLRSHQPTRHRSSRNLASNRRVGTYHKT